MPFTHTRTFHVRHYECDGYGHVNNANYLHYMQEAAFDASAAAGFGLDRYNEMNRVWLVRDTDIEYSQPLKYGDSVEVKTWVADFRKVRSRRAYEMRNAATGELVAKAMTDWAFLNLDTLRPAAIPDELIRGFFPDGEPEDIPPRTKFPTQPEPPQGVFLLRRRVEWRDIDPMKHVNNATYLSYMDDAAFEIGRAHGWPSERYIAEGFVVLVRGHRIEYLQPATMDDELEISTWVSDLRHVTGIRHYAIRRLADGELLARASSRVAWVNLSTGRPARIPEHFVADFADNIVAV